MIEGTLPVIGSKFRTRPIVSVVRVGWSVNPLWVVHPLSWLGLLVGLTRRRLLTSTERLLGAVRGSRGVRGLRYVLSAVLASTVIVAAVVVVEMRGRL